MHCHWKTCKHRCKIWTGNSYNLHASRTIESNRMDGTSVCARPHPYQGYEEKVFKINMEK